MDFSAIKGIGAGRKEILKNHGIETVEDLMNFFPSRYFDMSCIVGADKTESGGMYVIKATVTTEPVTKFVRKGFSFSRAQARCSVSGKTLSVLFYNRPYIKKLLQKDKEYVFFGKASTTKILTVLNPIFEPAGGIDKIQGIYSVYPSIRGVPKDIIKNAIAKVLYEYNPLSVGHGFLPEGMTLKDAYIALHAPRSIEETLTASRAVSQEELTQLVLAFKAIKQNKPSKRTKHYIDAGKEIDKVISGLPYALTDCQIAALNAILSDMSGDRYMNRLLQGDVGSGKTIIAFLAIYKAVLSGAQAVMMAPTEVLAHQHFEAFTKLFPAIPAALLTGGLPKSSIDTIRFNISTGTVNAVFGTHSLISKATEYNNLQLVITDEQHRFGVSQRSALEDKALTADTLIMSATPIPRTLALVIYGDLEVSILDKLPKGRKAVSTKIVPQNKLDDMLLYIAADAQKDRRTFIVLPKVEQSEDDDGESENESVKAMYASLKKGALKNTPLGLLYGSMKSKDKQAVMDDFSAGKIKVLVTTTVIEVGINIPEACNMVIYGADRYGLSQLHQLRGRIGRGTESSFCFLVYETGSELAKERIDLFCKTSSGFELAEFDLATRGAGDFIGLRQHGTGNLSNLRITAETISAARNAAEEIWTDSGGDVSKLKLKEKYRRIAGLVVLN